MRLLVNTSNLKIGGGIQVALSMIEEFKDFQEHEFHIIYSSYIANQLNLGQFPKNFYFYNINYSPVYLPARFITLKKINKLEKLIHPDCVLSIFGPSYWHPKAPHVMGFGLCHFLYPESPFWKTIGLKDDIYIKLLKIIKTWQLKKNANYFHVETMDAKLRMNKFWDIPLENILVATNSYHKIFDNFSSKISLPPKKNNEFRLITISSYYAHKNLEIINEVIKELNKQDEFIFQFFLTLPKNIFKKRFIDSENIINIGPLKIPDCPSAYAQCDAMFLPTLLEIFSANYPEAMKMGKPILTSDLPFAHDVCKNAAEYFGPLDPRKIAESILKVARNKDYRETLIENGFLRLKDLDTSRERAEKILNFCSNIISKNV